jgi:lysophospholipase L1-like esterase
MGNSRQYACAKILVINMFLSTFKSLMNLPFSKKRGFWIFFCAIGLMFEFSLAAKAQIQILPLGDSLTDGFQVPGGYRTELDQDLVHAGISFNFVGSQTDNASSILSAANETHHEGHSGYRIDQIYNNLTGNDGTGGNNGGYWLSGGGGTGRSALTPQIVLLEIGTNDFTGNFLNSDTDIASVNGRLMTLLNDLKVDLPNAQIFVGSLLPRTDSSALNTDQQAYNALIPGDVTAMGSKFHYVDLYDVVTPAEVAAGSLGVHPDQAGYNSMGDAWFNAIETVPEPPVLPLFGGGLALLAIIFRFLKGHRIVK